MPDYDEEFYTMVQVFRPKSNTIAKFSLVVIVLLFLGAFIVGNIIKWSPYVTHVTVYRDQPVMFSHRHHVKGDGIDCRYCHTSVETSSTAGMPSSETCMTCHSQIWTNSPMLKPVRDSFEKNQPIHWNRVYFLPDFVYFDHSIHVHKGIGCTSCHGQIDNMPLTAKARTFYMKDCLSCHREPERNVRPRHEVFNVDWKGPEKEIDRLKLGRKLVQDYGIDSHRITNCYTCHR